jgi:VWFA-related protein
MKTNGGATAALVLLCVFSTLAGPVLRPKGLNKQDKKDSDQSAVKITADLVQTDVLVKDKANKPLSGLRREDFEIFDDGKPQVITNFAYESESSRTLSDSEAGQPRSLPKAVTAKEVKRVMAFVVDTLHMKVENLYRTRQMLTNFIDAKMEAGDVVLVLPTAGGSGILQQFTSDQALLRSAVDRLRPFIFTNNATPHRDNGSNAVGTNINNGGSTVSQQTAGMGSSMGSGRGGGQGGGRSMPRTAQGPRTTPMDSVDPVEEADVRNTLYTLDNLIRAMSALPGRKLAVLISEGFRIYQTETTEDLRQTTDLAGRSGVVFYTIDPRGLDPLTVEASDVLVNQAMVSQAVKSVQNQKTNDFFESQDSLKAIAVDTGGRFFRDNNDIKAGLDSMLLENSAYYVLGFQPDPSKWDGKYHKLKVAVAGRPDLSIQARAGYLARSDKVNSNVIFDPAAPEEAGAINSPLVRRDIDLRLTPFYRDEAKQEALMVTVLHIDAGRLHFEQADGRYKNKLEIFGFMLDGGGKQVDGFKDTLDLNLLPKTYDLALRDGVLSTRSLYVKPGRYQMRVLVRETATGLIGTANNYVEVPDLKTDLLAMSSIFTLPDTPESGGVGNSASQAALLSQKRFKRGNKLEYMFVIYHATARDGKTDLEMRTQILKAGRLIVTSQPMPVQALQGSSPPGRILAGGAFTIGAQLPPDEYTLEVTVVDRLSKKDKQVIARQEIDFGVE